MAETTVGSIVIHASKTRYKAQTEYGQCEGARTGTCSLCGAIFAFSPGKHGQRFCSPNCRKKSWLRERLSINSITEIKRAMRELEARVRKLEGK